MASPYLADGRISAYVVFWASAIHAGAGSLLVTEAGGTVSDLDGRPWTIRSDSLVGSAIPISTKSCSALRAPRWTFRSEILQRHDLPMTR